MNYNNLIFYYCIMNLNEDELKQVNESLTQQLNPRFNPNMVMDNVKSAGDPKPSLEDIVTSWTFKVGVFSAAMTLALLVSECFPLRAPKNFIVAVAETGWLGEKVAS